MTLNQENFVQNLKPLLATPQLWEDRKNPLSMDHAKLLCRVDTVSRPDISPR